MSGWENIFQGMLTALGMFIMMTVLSILSYLALKNWIVKSISEMWVKVKDEVLKMNKITIKTKIEKKNNKNNK